MTRRILLALVSAMALSHAAYGGDNTTTKHGDMPTGSRSPGNSAQQTS